MQPTASLQPKRSAAATPSLPQSTATSTYCCLTTIPPGSFDPDFYLSKESSKTSKESLFQTSMTFPAEDNKQQLRQTSSKRMCSATARPLAPCSTLQKINMRAAPLPDPWLHALMLRKVNVRAAPLPDPWLRALMLRRIPMLPKQQHRGGWLRSGISGLVCSTLSGM